MAGQVCPWRQEYVAEPVLTTIDQQSESRVGRQDQELSSKPPLMVCLHQLDANPNISRIFQNSNQGQSIQAGVSMKHFRFKSLCPCPVVVYRYARVVEAAYNVSMQGSTGVTARREVVKGRYMNPALSPAGRGQSRQVRQ